MKAKQNNLTCTIKVLSISLIVTLLAGCTGSNSSLTTVKRESFNKAYEGKQVDLFTLKNKNGMSIQITNYGGNIVSLMVPDKNGKTGDIVLGYKTLEEYVNGTNYFGALVGRYANRISKGMFALEGDTYKLATNNGENHLHGGITGFNKVVWDAKQTDSKTLELKYLSKDGEEGYPGNLNVTVIYSLNDNNELSVEYFASTDKTTIINLTSHSYFNLAGEGDSSILDHELVINADNYTPVDKGLIPTGEIISVKNTPMDFTIPEKIGSRINQDYEQLELGQGYDHNYVLNKSNDSLTLAASLSEPSSGRLMEVYTTEPGIQFYSGNFLNGTVIGKKGIAYAHRSGLCLEPQHFPDSPNKPEFPSTVLKPGEKYYSRTVFKFSALKK